MKVFKKIYERIFGHDNIYNDVAKKIKDEKNITIDKLEEAKNICNNYDLEKKKLFKAYAEANTNSPDTSIVTMIGAFVLGIIGGEMLEINKVKANIAITKWIIAVNLLLYVIFIIAMMMWLYTKKRYCLAKEILQVCIDEEEKKQTD